MRSDGASSNMVQQVLNSATLHIIWAIWIERNQRCFSDVKRSMESVFNVVLSEVHLSFNLSIMKGRSDMVDYQVSNFFNIPFKTKRAIIAKMVVWTPPTGEVVKINCDGSSYGTNPCGAIGFVLRGSSSIFLGALASNIDFASSLEAEFCAFMLAIDKAKDHGLTSIWMETDSMAVVNAFHKDIGIPWKMRRRWHNCMHFCNLISCTCTHILREGNMAADALAKNAQGLALYSSQWWSSPPPFISSFSFER